MRPARYRDWRISIFFFGVTLGIIARSRVVPGQIVISPISARLITPAMRPYRLVVRGISGPRSAKRARRTTPTKSRPANPWKMRNASLWFCFPYLVIELSAAQGMRTDRLARFKCALPSLH